MEYQTNTLIKLKRINRWESYEASDLGIVRDAWALDERVIYSGAGFLDLSDVLFSELNCDSIDMLNILVVALYELCIASHTLILLNSNFGNLIDLHIGIDYFCVDLLWSDLRWKVTGNGKWEKWYVMDHQSVTNLQNLVHGFWEDSKALVYRGSRKSPDRLGQGQYETNCEL